MMHNFTNQPQTWPVLMTLALLYLLLSGCASQPKTPSADADARARTVVVNAAQRMLGAPYRPGGYDPNGFDCSGLTHYSYGNAGIAIPRTAAEQYRAAKQNSKRQLQIGDLIFFNTEGRKISHVGIFVGDGRFIHAPSSGKSVRLDALDDSYWRTRIHGSGHYYY